MTIQISTKSIYAAKKIKAGLGAVIESEGKCLAITRLSTQRTDLQPLYTETTSLKIVRGITGRIAIRSNPNFEFVDPAKRAKRIKELVSLGNANDLESAAMLLFSCGDSFETIQKIIEEQKLEHQLVLLCEAGNPNSVADYFYQLAINDKKEGINKIIEISRGKTAAKYVYGFTSYRRLAVVLFKLSMKNNGSGRKVVDNIFCAARELLEPGILESALNELNRQMPHIFKNYAEFSIPQIRTPLFFGSPQTGFKETSTFKTEGSSLLKERMEARRDLTIEEEIIAPEISKTRRPVYSSCKALVLRNDPVSNLSKYWDFGYADARETLIASVQDLTRKGDYKSACFLLFGIPRRIDEISSVLRIEYLTSEEIRGILEVLDNEGLRSFLVEVAKYGREKEIGESVERLTNYIDPFFYGILLTLSKMPIQTLTDVLDMMINHKEEEQKEAAYYLLREGLNPFKTYHLKYTEALETMCARDGYLQPIDFILHGKLLVTDEAVAIPNTRGKIKFYDNLMRENNPSIVRLKAMVCLAQLGKGDIAKKYLSDKFTKILLLECILELAAEHSRFLTLYNLDILLGLVDYDCEAVAYYDDKIQILGINNEKISREDFISRLRDAFLDTLIPDSAIIDFIDYLDKATAAINQIKRKEQEKEWCPEFITFRR